MDTLIITNNADFRFRADFSELETVLAVELVGSFTQYVDLPRLVLPVSIYIYVILIETFEQNRHFFS